jgi:predicted nucleic acid-binding protein
MCGSCAVRVVVDTNVIVSALLTPHGPASDRWSQVAKLATAAPIPGSLKGMPDPDDAVFLEVAYSGRADALITSNLKHYPERLRHGVEVVTPMGFVANYLRPAKPEPVVRPQPRPHP